ncbi:hypothetical protein FOA52_015921 [Chlamydomonas sp. UWO 241]|nr:hypothetical protein FOA52_015921 [Chlamydomonas sp. UWO 241]
MPSSKQLTGLKLLCQLPSDAAWQRIMLTVAPRLQRLIMPNYSVLGLGVLSACTSLTALDLSGTSASCLDAVASCTRLETLNLQGCAGVFDLGFARALTSLKALDLSRTSVSDLAPLACCTALEELLLKQLLSATGLPSMPCSEIEYEWMLHRDDPDEFPLSPQVARCARISDISPLASLTDLRLLSLFGCVAVKSIQPLQHCCSLEVLDLRLVIGQHPLDLSPLVGAELELLYLMSFVQRLPDTSGLSQKTLGILSMGCVSGGESDEDDGASDHSGSDEDDEDEWTSYSGSNAGGDGESYSYYSGSNDGESTSASSEWSEWDPVADAEGSSRGMMQRDVLSDLPAGVLDQLVTVLQRDGAAGCAGLRAASKALQGACDGATRSLVLRAPKARLTPLRPRKRWCMPILPVASNELQSTFTALVARTPQLTGLELLCQLPSDAAWQRIMLTVAPRLQRLIMPNYSVLGLGVLSACTSLTALDLSGTSASCLDAVASCTRLETLNLQGCAGVFDLGFARALTSLKALDLSRTSVSDLAPLACCTALEELLLKQLLSATGLPGMPCSEIEYEWMLHRDDPDEFPLSPQVARCARITDISPLASLTDLRLLSLFGCVAVNSIQPLQHCCSLEVLDLGMVLGEHPLDLSPLTSCSELKRLMLVSFVNRLPDASCLSQAALGIISLGREFSNDEQSAGSDEEDDDAASDDYTGSGEDDDDEWASCSWSECAEIDWAPGAYANAATRFAEWQAENTGSSGESDSDDVFNSSQASSSSGWEEVESDGERQELLMLLEGQQQQQTGLALQSWPANVVALFVVFSVLIAWWS